jgi:hypothetical protein
MDGGLSMSGRLFKTVAAGGGVTKEFYVPCTTVSDVGILSYYGSHPVAQLTIATDSAFISFRIPHDYNSIVVASIVVIPKFTTAGANWDIYSNYAQVGESYQAHNESDAATTYNVTNNQIFEVNIAGILTSLTANDIVGIKITQSNSSHDVNVLGVRFKYL